nr:hypothetical protein [Bacillus velezensis]
MKKEELTWKHCLLHSGLMVKIKNLLHLTTLQVYCSGRYAKIADDFESQDSERLFTNEQVEFVCNTFGQKFAPDEFEKGIDARLVGRTIYLSPHSMCWGILQKQRPF